VRWLAFAIGALVAVTAGSADELSRISSGGRTPDVTVRDSGDRKRVIGRSVDGRAIVARRWGDREAGRTMLVVGSIHGDELEGHRVVFELTGPRLRRLDGVEVWTVTTVNPDGVDAGTRGNAHGVDLNRNFPEGWKAIPPSSGYYSGPRPGSEPETRDVLRFLRRIRPELTVWYHQPWGQTLVPCGGGGRRVALRYARLSGLPARDCFPSPPGSATGWQRERQGAKAFVVELPGGDLNAGEVRRHARSLRQVATPVAG
jgi:murein peptide amidase A